MFMFHNQRPAARHPFLQDTRRRACMGMLMIFAAAFLLSGCSHMLSESNDSSRSAGVSDTASDAAEETVEFNGIVKKRSELTDDTLKWLDWYHSLPEEQRLATNFIPSEFASELSKERYAMETSQDTPAYTASLTEEELQDTAELARHYFTELSPELDGVEQLIPAEDSDPQYQNAGIEREYAPGNIIIYHVETTKDKEEGNPMRSISIARRSKSDEWKVINSSY